MMRGDIEMVGESHAQGGHHAAKSLHELQAAAMRSQRVRVQRCSMKATYASSTDMLLALAAAAEAKSPVSGGRRHSRSPTSPGLLRRFSRSSNSPTDSPPGAHERKSSRKNSASTRSPVSPGLVGLPGGDQGESKERGMPAADCVGVASMLVGFEDKSPWLNFDQARAANGCLVGYFSKQELPQTIELMPNFEVELTEIAKVAPPQLTHLLTLLIAQPRH